MGYNDERIWPHILPSTLDDFPRNGTKWKKHEAKRSYGTN